MAGGSYKRFLLTTLSLAVGLSAQYAVGGPNASRAWPLFTLYGLAIVLFVIAARDAPPVAFAGGHDGQRAPAPGSGSAIGRAGQFLLGLAVANMLASVVLFVDETTYPTAWLFHLAAVLLFVTAFVVSNRPSAPRPLETTLRQALPIVAVLALGAMARLWQLEEHPFGTWYDEASNGIDAMQILEDPSYRPLYVASIQMPAHFPYLVALSFSAFGPSTASIRLVTAAFGIAGVLFAYLLFRRWFGNQLGLGAAALLAVMRYHLTVSRFGMQAVTTPAFELAFLYLLDRGFERRRPRDFAWVGLTLGFGMAFYYAFRLFPVALVIFGAVMIARAWRHRAPSSGPRVVAESQRLAQHPWRAPLAACALGFVIATAPITQFALQHPDVFFERTGTVSIFSDRDEPNLAKALLSNTSQHLLMFNLRGDGNGRHNLPGEPMLDTVTGTLFVFGIALGLRRWRDPANLLMLLLFFIMLLAGILSLDYEAPQSLRSVGVIPSLVYFATLSLAAIGSSLARWRRDDGESAAAARLAPVALAALLLLVSFLNFATFFGKQKLAADTWVEHSTAETIAGREMHRLAPSHDLIVSSSFDGHPTVRFLAPRVTSYRRWTLEDRFPLTDSGSRPVAVLLDRSLVTAFETARRYYPNATFREFRPPLGGDPIVYQAEISPEDLRAVAGVVARYFGGTEFRGLPLKEETLSALAADWSEGPPFTEPFSAEFLGTLYVREYGSHLFSVRGPEISTLTIDGWPVGPQPITLAIGPHALRLRVPGGGTRVALWWQPPGAAEMEPVPPGAFFRPPVTPTGLLGTYYRSPNWTGPPAFARIDPAIAFYFQDPSLPRPYSVEWSGKILAPETGKYRFATDSIDESLLFIDRELIVRNEARTLVEGETDLERGWHDLVLRFADRTSHTQIYLSWLTPGGSEPEIIPSVYLSPPRGDGYPDGPESSEALASEAAKPPSQEKATIKMPRQGGSQPLSLAHVRTIGGSGTGPGRFREPRAVAAGAGGRVFVADAGNERVQILDEAGSLVAAIHLSQEEPSEPFDLTIAANGDLIVLDSLQGWLYRFDPLGRALGRFAGPSAGFYHPRGLCAGADDKLYVADTGGARIVKMSVQGEPLAVLGTEGDERERLSQPSHVAVDAEGFFFVVDVQAGRIMQLQPDGTYRSDFRIPGATSVDAPRIALTAEGSLLVSAPTLDRIQQYSYDGRLLGEWGESGNGPGQFRLPTGIAVHGDAVWVADTGNDRIQKWEIRR